MMEIRLNRFACNENIYIRKLNFWQENEGKERRKEEREIADNPHIETKNNS